MEWHTEEPQLYSSGLNSGTVCFITNESQSGSLSFMNACIKIAITIITLIILLKTINYNIKFPLILQSMIHFVSLFISKTYQNMIVNLLLAVFRQIFEMTDTCIYREIFLFFPQILRWHARIFTERYIRYSGHQNGELQVTRGVTKWGQTCPDPCGDFDKVDSQMPGSWLPKVYAYMPSPSVPWMDDANLSNSWVDIRRRPLNYRQQGYTNVPTDKAKK